MNRAARISRGLFGLGMFLAFCLLYAVMSFIELTADQLAGMNLRRGVFDATLSRFSNASKREPLR